MKYRKIGNSSLELSVVTFGAWAAGGWMWGGNEEAESINAIKAAYEYGVTSIDTAPVYGQGASERIIGKALKEIPRDKVQILTKYGLQWLNKQGEFYFNTLDNQGHTLDIYRYASKDSIIRECEESLRLLNTDYIDLYQIHWPDPTTPIQETMEAVDRLIQSGKVRYAGVSNFSEEQFKEADKFVNVISNQVSYSMIKREIENDLVPYMIENKKSILAYSPLGRGLLTGKLKPGHKFSEGDHRASIPAYRSDNIKLTNDFLKKIEPLAHEKNASIGQLVIRWTIEQTGITIALVGARNAEQAIQNAAAADIELSELELVFISNELDKLKLIE